MLSPNLVPPDWVPVLPDGKKILIVGASGGIGRALVQMIGMSDVKIGAHFATTDEQLKALNIQNASIHFFKKEFKQASDCDELVDEFSAWAGGIDSVVILAGGIRKGDHFMNLSSEEWESDIFLNLSIPFYLSRAGLKRIRDHGKGGRIILTGTESALHGGSAVSFPYAIAKAGTECMVKGLAREGAKDNILVNGIRPGFIASGFHERWHHRNKKEMKERADLVPLKRGGTPEEASALMTYLLSEWANFITGQMFAITGGDWL